MGLGLGLDGVEQLLETDERLHLHQRPREGAHLRRGHAAQRVGCGGEGVGPADGRELPVDAQHGCVEPLPLEAIDGVPGLVGDPLLVDRLVEPRQDAHHLVRGRGRGWGEG